MVQGAATTEHCQNTALRVWEIPGKNPNKKTGVFETGHGTFFFLLIICEQQRLER
jgi:anti-sigma-K factor RskA